MKNFAMLFLMILLMCFSNPAWGLEELTDEQLHAVTAGGQDAASGSAEALTRIPFRYNSAKAKVDGEVIVVPMTLSRQTASLTLTGHAQSNLRSLININAVNSPIQVLLNLNINVNSRIGSLNQWNQLLSAKR